MPLESESVRAYIEKVKILINTDRFDEAQKQINEALAFAPSIQDETIRNNLYDYCYLVNIQIFLGGGEFQKAVDIGLQGLNQYPDAKFIRRGLVQTYQYLPSKVNREQVSILCEYLLKQDPESVDNLNCKIIELKMLQHESNDKAYFEGKIETIEDSILEIDPDNSDILVTKGNRMIAAKKFADAENLLKRLVEKDPTNATFLINYAIVLAETKRVEQAKDIFFQVLVRNPNNFNAKSNLKKITTFEFNFVYRYIRLLPLLPFAPAFGLLYGLLMLPVKVSKTKKVLPPIMGALCIIIYFLHYILPTKILIIDLLIVLAYSTIGTAVFLALVNWYKKAEDKKFEEYLQEKLQSYESGH